MDGLKSNAGGFEYKLNEVNVADNWNPKANNPEEMGGFNFGTEDKILRWLHRGDTIYDVILPKDSEIILVDELKGIYRSNKIIVTNPRIITDQLVIDLYKKTTLSNKIIAQCLVTLLWKERIEIVKYIIKDRINLDNINDFIEEFKSYAGKENMKYDSCKEIYEILKEIQDPLDISVYISKEPYIKKLTNDNIINLTGQSGSGKSYYAKQNFSDDKYEVIDTDDIFFEKRFEQATGLNRKLGMYFRDNYDELPNLTENFDKIYNDIINYCKKINKIIIIDCAQFHCCKDITILKGKIIIIRTDIDTCYNRAISRWIETNPVYTQDELNAYKNRKKGIFKWYKTTNEFINKIDKL